MTKSKVHKVLAHSYYAYFLLFVVGIFLDLMFPLEIFENSVLMPVGFGIIALGSVLILWAQKSSRTLSVKTLSKETFRQGPYRFLSNPTHWGLSMLLFGFGITVNAMYVVSFTAIYFILDHLVFLRKQNDLLEEKYGEHFRDYKKSVKF